MSASSKKRKLSIAVGDKVDALWPADGEYYPAKVRAINDDGTVALDYADGDRRNGAATSELRCKKPITAPSTPEAPVSEPSEPSPINPDDALRLSYAPEETSHREAEYEAIRRFFAERLEQRRGGSLYVCGAPGTGKTLHVERARSHVLGSVATRDAKACFLRGTAFASGDAFLRAVAKGVCSSSVLQGDPERGELLLRLKETCDAGTKTNPVLRVVVVDEIDSLLKCGGEALRKVYGLATRETSTLALIGVANAIDVPRRAFFGDIPASCEEASRHGTVVFRPYEHKQLVDIVKQRVGEGVFAAPALEFVARKVAAHSGDARRALDACRAALLSARRHGEHPVSMARAAEAIRESGGATHGPLAAVASLPHHAHVALRAALDLSTNADRSFTRSALATAYARLQPQLGRRGDCAGAADDSVALLESAGLVGAAPDRRSKALKARNPGQAKLRVLVDADDARAALERGARSSALAPAR